MTVENGLNAVVNYLNGSGFMPYLTAGIIITLAIEAFFMLVESRSNNQK